MKKTILLADGKTRLNLDGNRYDWVTQCIKNFKHKYPEYYYAFCKRNKEVKQQQANHFAVEPTKRDEGGRAYGKADLGGWRFSVMFPVGLLKWINARLPDPEDKNQEQVPVIQPQFLAQGQKHYETAKKDIKWLKENYPEFIIPDKL